jgi:predicted nucleic acid-binding protein
MALAYLVDTNVVSELEKIPSNPNVVAQIEKYRDRIAIAAANDLILVTRNVKDFTLFTEVDIENWFEV